MSRKKQLEHNLAKLPEKAYLKNTLHCNGPQGEPPVICVKKGVDGYWPIYTKTTAEALNKTLGVTERQASAMRWGSMFGWDTSGADPDDPIHEKGPV
jgi:hypothetical protein